MVKMTQQFATRPWKTLFFRSLSPEETVNTELDEIRFHEVAIAMGAFGARVQSPAALEKAIEKAIKADSLKEQVQGAIEAGGDIGSAALKSSANALSSAPPRLQRGVYGFEFVTCNPFLLKYISFLWFQLCLLMT